MAVDEDKFGIKKKQEELLAETRKLPPGRRLWKSWQIYAVISIGR